MIGGKTSDIEGFELVGNRTIDSKHELLEDLLKARNHSGGRYFMLLIIQGLCRKNSQVRTEVHKCPSHDVSARSSEYEINLKGIATDKF